MKMSENLDICIHDINTDTNTTPIEQSLVNNLLYVIDKLNTVHKRQELPFDITNRLILTNLSNDTIEQQIFSDLLQKMNIHKNVYKFDINVNMEVDHLISHIRYKNYHTLIRCILTNNHYIIINIAGFAALLNDQLLLNFCNYYMEIHHIDKMDEFNINIFINMIKSPNQLVFQYINYFSTFDWFYEQYDIFLEYFILRNSLVDLNKFIGLSSLNNAFKEVIFLTDNQMDILIDLTIKHNLFDIFLFYYKEYFKFQQVLINSVIVHCVIHNNLKIIKFVIKNIKFVGGKYKHSINNSASKFLAGRYVTLKN